MQAVTRFTKDHYHHILGAASVAAISHGVGSLGSSILENSINDSISKPSEQTNLRVGLLSASILTTAAAGWASPSKLRAPVLLYTIAFLFPMIAWKYDREVTGEGENRLLKEINGTISKITRQNSYDFEDRNNFLVLYGFALPIIGAMGLLLANIHLFKFTLPILRKMGLPRNLLSVKEYRPLLPAVRGFVKFSSGFAIGQGLGALFWRIFIEDVNKVEYSESLRVKRWSRTFINLGSIAATVTLFTGCECLGKYKRLIPMIFSGIIGFSWLKTEEYQLRSSILPVDVTDKYHAISLIGVGSAAYYLGTHPKISTLFQLIVNG
ncbi:MAG: hypothetical protein SNF33_06765 [Candidatus Algichlamydia australiensis]|nr:hypothetical protein [Chlamydiales bacterium]